MRNRHSGTGTSWTVSTHCPTDARGERNTFTETRNQPTLPINTSLTGLLEMVRNATDPFLLFLYVLLMPSSDMLFTAV